MIIAQLLESSSDVVYNTLVHDKTCSQVKNGSVANIPREKNVVSLDEIMLLTHKTAYK